MLWKRAFNTMEAELRRLGYTTNLREDPTRDAPERRAIRVVSGDVVLDLYIRNGFWTFDQWFKSEGGWLHSIKGEAVQDRYRHTAGLTNLTSRTPHQIVIDTLIYNFNLPEPGTNLAPDAYASHVPGTPPGPVVTKIPEKPQPKLSTLPVSQIIPAPAAVPQDIPAAEQADDRYETAGYVKWEPPVEWEAPAKSGKTPEEAMEDIQIVLAAARWLEREDPEGVHMLVGWGSMYDTLGRRTDGYLIASGKAMGFFRPEELRLPLPEDSAPLIWSTRQYEVARLGKPSGVSLNFGDHGVVDENRMGLFTLQLVASGGNDLNFSIEYGQYDFEGKKQVVGYMEELLERFSW